jgi:predicted  nucleic acid-binding Zn-ribbon protein
MSLYWFQCEKCETLIKNDSTPRLNGCPEGHSHDWNKIGEVGDRNFQCKKCGIVVQIDSTPRLNGCPKGHSHDWKKM